MYLAAHLARTPALDEIAARAERENQLDRDGDNAGLHEHYRPPSWDAHFA